MQRFVSTWFVSAVALAFAAWLLGNNMNIGESGDAGVGRVFAVLLVALVFTLINGIVAPIVKTLSIPFIIITLGLALLVINALLLLLTAWVTDRVGVHFEINGFGWAVIASIVISLSQTIVGAVVGGDKRRRLR